MDSGNDSRDGSGGVLPGDPGNTRYLVNNRALSARDTRRVSEPHAKSIRLSPRAARGGLAMRLAIPIIAAVLLGLVIIGLFMQYQVERLQLAFLRNNAANSCFAVGMLGRQLITHREQFLRDHPDYAARGEWRTGDHWLVTHGFVSEEDWVEATGFELDESAPAAAMERAGEKTILARMAHWVNTPTGTTEMVGVYLMNADGTIMARAMDENFRYDALALRAIPLPEAATDIAGLRVSVDYLADVRPEPLVRGVARIMSESDPEQEVGRAAVILRTARHKQEQRSLLYMSLGLAGLLALLMSVVCWYAARRVTVPMRKLASEMQAMAEGDYARRSGIADNDEIGLLAQAFDSMAERLRVARANEKETSRLESDLAIARGIQNNLLPLQTPRVRGYDIHTTYKPAREIGGDYFDFLPVDSQHMGIVVADASGKSIPAALVMSTTRAILRFVAPGMASASETLTRVNAILSVDIPKGMFVTAYYVILDPLNHHMICSSAGHTPLLIARADGSVELMNPGGIALGFDGGPIFQRSIREQQVQLQPGDRVLLYTDGVVECVNPANEEYSDRRLREFLRRNRDLSSHDFVGALLADLDRHRGAADMRDDTTVVTFKVL